ncbi:GntR family transcriptional regulator [Azorhizobium doebereinerae]|uniref:GntR family transcriptional regulator n=1 Tax=Azorhizobium doebereinerae TaxID=281091 RepID=UPI00040091EE|nr:GntR family transcriptional regulator [Azorhizobium doebereinerae]
MAQASSDGDGGRLGALPPEDLVSRIAATLSGAIVAGRFAPGARLNEVHLAAELGVSRAPLREAARLLENRGLVVSHPRRGFFVRELTARALDDVYDLRMALERHAGLAVCAGLTKAMAAALRAQAARIDATTSDPGRQVEEDFAFHRMICAFAGNERLLRVYDELTTEMRLGIVVIGHLYDDPEEIARTHDPVLEALLSRDPARWIAAIDHHIGVARTHVVRLLTEREGAPDDT